MTAPASRVLQAGAAIDAARRELRVLVDHRLPSAQSACATVRASYRWIERVVEQARAVALDITEHDTRSALLLEVSTLDIELGSLRPQVDEMEHVREVLR